MYQMGTPISQSSYTQKKGNRTTKCRHHTLNRKYQLFPCIIKFERSVYSKITQLKDTRALSAMSPLNIIF